MAQAPTIHFVDRDVAARAEGARLALALGLHAEVYSGIEEIARHAPREGIIVVRDDALPGGVREILAAFPKAGVGLPIVIASESRAIGRIVDAIRAGAIDFLHLPLDREKIALMVERANHYAVTVGRVRQRMIEARTRIATLSEREREVLQLLCEGASNKLIARELDISPRTVEIHRANMMDKLGARHVADAVRMHFDSIPEWVVQGWPPEDGPERARRQR